MHQSTNAPISFMMSIFLRSFPDLFRVAKFLLAFLRSYNFCVKQSKIMSPPLINPLTRGNKTYSRQFDLSTGVIPGCLICQWVNQSPPLIDPLTPGSET